MKQDERSKKYLYGVIDEMSREIDALEAKLELATVVSPVHSRSFDNSEATITSPFKLTDAHTGEVIAVFKTEYQLDDVIENLNKVLFWEDQLEEA